MYRLAQTQDAMGFLLWAASYACIAGTNDNSVYIYDIESKKSLSRFRGHNDDVNAVAYLRDDDPNLIVSGCDDDQVRLWDARDKAGAVRKPQGVLVGVCERIFDLV
eukprot:GHRR01018332.1.p2 GENE.GHRR01018332.1~~GHRR01018332.1.p2  ORF type:complete len:106 (+),score=25.25 GHRR01018332.1:1406-1723(+)